ncbi:FAD-dependent monooxygenase [Pedococcus sp. KACC 23699]|uniref:FAD-dependent monooxygenase n=1 Tax=Pedococcus sp. KACC 23699 TaxID=3149228 RepID=A0AAU7JXN5_9MICO
MAAHESTGTTAGTTDQTAVETTDVLVVGAGPTGLALAAALLHQGVRTITVDRATEGANTSRAAVVHARTLEVLEGIDVTARLLAEGVVVPTFTVRDGRRVVARLDFSDLPTPYPFTLMIPQHRTEQLLTERLAELGGGVERGWALVGLELRPGPGARAFLRSTSGEERSVDARYVVGADGMHSAVREHAGIAFDGARYAQSFVLADVRMDWPLADDEVQLFFSAQGLVVVAPLPGGRHRVVATMDEAPESPSRADVQALLDARGPGNAAVTEVVWSSRFRVHHRVAAQYRRGPVFVAGDAAHVHSPAGGQGMNTGIQDALDLAGRLATAVRGGEGDAAAEAALAAYETSRRPVALEVVQLTDRATRAATLRSPGARAVRNALIGMATRVPAVRRKVTTTIAELRA